MPTESTNDQKKRRKAFAARLDAGMKHAGYGYHGGKTAFAKLFPVKAPVVTEWLAGQYIPEYDKVRLMAEAFECSADWLYTGEGDAPEWMGGVPAKAPAGIFTKERRASDDVLAVQIGLESLLLAVFQRTPGAAGAFLADVKPIAKGHGFSTKAGFLGSLVDIAKEVHSEEEAAAQARQLGGSAARTRRGNPGPKT
jgi:hypothetical protein